MSEAGLIVLLLVFFVVPFLGLYLAVNRETSNPTVVNRSEAEQIAQERGGRPDARERNREQETDSADEWGTTDEWGASGERDDRR